MLKRLFDAVVAACALAVLCPVMGVVAVLVKREDRGPILYSGIRVGRDGTLFRMHKFRTMVINADSIGGPSTADNDLRITRVGKALRQYKLDELPQLFNVLKGEMSLVGPRPEVPEYVALFNEDERAILGVRPGITDWASLWDSDEGAALAGAADPERAYLELIRPTKLRLQLEYVRRRSFWVDLKILWSTFLTVVSRGRTVPHLPLLPPERTKRGARV